MTTTEAELYEMLRNEPDFDRLPLPSSWFKKFNIPPREAQDTRTFIESGYTLMRQLEQKDLPPLFIDEPQQNGKLVVVPEQEPIKVETIVRPFEWDSTKRFPDVLPMLKELPDLDANNDASPCPAVPPAPNHNSGEGEHTDVLGGSPS